MAITRLAFGGSGAAYGVFAPKDAGAAPTGQSPRPSRYRTGHRVTHYHPLLLLAAWLWR